MPGTDPDPTPVRDAEAVLRREAVRRSMLRTNSAVGVILVLMLLLGTAMIVVGYRARRDQERAERAEAEAGDRLWRSYLAQARAERLGTDAGHRAAALAAIKKAAEIRPSVELRDEAIAAFGLRDLEPAVTWPLQPRAYGFHFDPALEHYVVSYADAEISLFRLKDNQLVRTFRASEAGLDDSAKVAEFFFSPTGQLVVQYTPGIIVVWDKDSGRALHVFGAKTGEERFAWMPSFTTDGRQMLAASATAKDRVVITDIASGTNRSLRVPGVLSNVRLSPKGDVFVWFREGEVFLHDAVTGELRQTLPAPWTVLSLWWDWTGDQFSVACGDATVHVWSSRRGRFRQLGGRVFSAWMQQFSPDGSLLITAGADGATRLWDTAESRLLAQTTSGRALAFSRDGRRIGYGVPGKSVGVWNVTEPLGLRLVRGSERQAVFGQDLSPNGRWAVLAHSPLTEAKGFELIDLKSGQSVRRTSSTGEVMVGFHPLEPKLFVAGDGGFVWHGLPSTNSASASTETGRVPLPEGFHPCAFAFSGDGRRVFLTDRSGQLRVVDMAPPWTVTPLEGSMRFTRIFGPAGITGGGGIAMNHDGLIAVAGFGGEGNRPQVFDAKTGRKLTDLDTEASHVVFSKDGRWLNTIGVRWSSLWDATTWKRVWQDPRAGLISSGGAAAFAAEQPLLAEAPSVDKVELTDPASGERLAVISSSSMVTVSGLRMSADGGTMMVLGSGTSLHLWDLKAIREQLAALRLDWPLAKAGGVHLAGSGPVSPGLLAGLGLMAVVVSGTLGWAVLRRHARLTGDFIETTDTAARQAHQLAAERELNQLKGRFISMVSHEFRTPLGIIMSAVELLENYMERLPAPKRAELLADIHTSTKRMAELMEQVLFLGRVEAGRLQLAMARIEIEPLCHKLLDEALSATDGRCPVKLRVDVSPADIAHGDEAVMRHIFSNLISNAAKYSPAGETVTWTVVREGDEAVFTIADRGIGIPASDLPRLFEAFHRARNVGETPGTGLGLVIVKQCTELHGGKIEVVSREGEGTTFTVRLPLFRLPPAQKTVNVPG